MLKWEWICKLFGHIYPLKKLPTSEYLKEMFNISEEEGAYVADTDKPCARCGKGKNGT